MRNGSVRKTALGAVLAALIAVIVLLGSILDIADLAFVSVASLALTVLVKNTGLRFSATVFAVSAAVCLVLSPLSTATVYYVTFFGYYPILRGFLERKFHGKYTAFAALFLLFNIIMPVWYFLLVSIFGMQGESKLLIIALCVTSDIFFLAFHRLSSVIYKLYLYMIYKRKLKK